MVCVGVVALGIDGRRIDALVSLHVFAAAMVLSTSRISDLSSVSVWGGCLCISGAFLLHSMALAASLRYGIGFLV